MLQARNPTPQQESAWTPPMPTPYVFDEFNGINTKPSRTAIEQTQLYICDGFIPFGKNNARTLYGIGSSVFTASVTNPGTTIVWYDFGNIGNNYIGIVLTSDGALWQVNVATSMVTKIASAGTITNPSPINIGMAQAGNRFIEIIAAQTNGYFLWDGVNLYQAGTLGPDITVINSGQYLSAPTLTTWGGTGLGGTLSSQLFNGAAYSFSVASVGSGYSSTDFPIIVSTGGGIVNKTAKLKAYLTNGSVTSIGINDAGLGYTSVASLAFIGGTGAGVAGTVTTSASSISGVSVAYSGNNYTIPPTPYVVDPYNTIVQGYVDTMPYGVSGTAIENYVNRAWVVNGSAFAFTAPSSLVNFAASFGGGTQTSTDSFLRNNFWGAKQTNGFLYLIGDDSVNTISGVTVGASGVTTYSNQNADPEVGSNWPKTIGTISRNIIFANTQGVYICSGGTVTKISEVLDGIYSTASSLGNFIPSAAKATIFGIRCWMVLLPILDQVSGLLVNKLLMTDGTKWWTSNQDATLTYIATQITNSKFTAYGTDGNNIYPLFQNPSINFTKTLQTRLNTEPGYDQLKVGNRLWGMLNYYSTLSPSITVSADSEISTNPVSYSISPLTANWINNAGAAAIWYNNASVPANWGIIGNGIVVFPPIAVGQQGVSLGLTLSTNAADMAIVSLSLGWAPWGYRG